MTKQLTANTVTITGTGAHIRMMEFVLGTFCGGYSEGDTYTITGKSITANREEWLTAEDVLRAGLEAHDVFPWEYYSDLANMPEQLSAQFMCLERWKDKSADCARRICRALSQPIATSPCGERWLKRRGDRYVMSNGYGAEHSLWVSETDEARLRAHWDGFCR